MRRGGLPGPSSFQAEAAAVRRDVSSSSLRPAQAHQKCRKAGGRAPGPSPAADDVHAGGKRRQEEEEEAPAVCSLSEMREAVRAKRGKRERCVRV